MTCATHKAEAVGVCAYCGRAVCSECTTSPNAARLACSAKCAEGLANLDNALQFLVRKSAQNSRASAFYCYLCALLSGVGAIVAWYQLPSPFLIMFCGGCSFVLALSGVYYTRVGWSSSANPVEKVTADRK